MSDNLITNNDEYSLENLSDIVNSTLLDFDLFDLANSKDNNKSEKNDELKNTENPNNEGSIAMSVFVAPSSESAPINPEDKLTWAQKRYKDKLEKEALIAKAKEEAAIESRLAERLAELDKKEKELQQREKAFTGKQKQILAIVAKKQGEIIANAEKERAKQQQVFDENLAIEENAFREKLRLLEEEQLRVLAEQKNQAKQKKIESAEYLKKTLERAESIIREAQDKANKIISEVENKYKNADNEISVMKEKAETEIVESKAIAEEILRLANQEVSAVKQAASEIAEKIVKEASDDKENAENKILGMYESARNEIELLRTEAYEQIAKQKSDADIEVAALLEKTRQKIEEDIRNNDLKIVKVMEECKALIHEQETKSKELIESNERLSEKKIAENEKKSEERIKLNEKNCDAILAERKKALNEKEIEFYRKLNEDQISFDNQKEAELKKLDEARTAFEIYCDEERKKIEADRLKMEEQIAKRIAEQKDYETKIKDELDIQRKEIEAAQIYNTQYHDELKKRVSDFEADMKKRIKQLEIQQNKVASESVKKYTEIFRREQELYERSLKISAKEKQLGIESEEYSKIEHPGEADDVSDILAHIENNTEDVVQNEVEDEILHKSDTVDIMDPDFNKFKGFHETHFDETSLNPDWKVKKRKHNYETGDIFPYLGKNYVLRVENVDDVDYAEIILADDEIILKAGKRASVLTRRKLFNQWYNGKFEEYLLHVVDGIKEKLNYPGVIDVSIANDISKWFSSNHDQKCILVNSDLIKTEPIFLEYALMSELIKFKIHDSKIPNKLIKLTYEKEMDKYFSGWQKLRELLSSLTEL